MKTPALIALAALSLAASAAQANLLPSNFWLKDAAGNLLYKTDASGVPISSYPITDGSTFNAATGTLTVPAGLANFSFGGDTDSPSDPPITITQMVVNPGPAAWTGYVVDVTAFSNTTINPGITFNPSAPFTPGPSSVTPGVNGSAHITYQASPPVGPGSFTYSFTLDMLPNASDHYAYAVETGPVLVPEPASLSLLALAGTGLLLRRRR